MKLHKRFGAFSYTLQTAIFLSLDYVYVPARDIEASLRYYTGKLGGELVWKIHALSTRIAAVRLCVDFARRSSSRRHAHSDLRVERLESAVARLRV
jgi:catechol 2,3-dioxygenase-like lactoylglutathione lyase family enzyme